MTAFLLVTRAARPGRPATRSAPSFLWASVSVSGWGNPKWSGCFRSAGGQERGSYPPETLPLLAPGAAQDIRYTANAHRIETTRPVIDLVSFADGSSYGPNGQRSQGRYIARVEAQYLFAQQILEILETQGADAAKEVPRQAVQDPNPVLRPAPKLSYFQSRRDTKRTGPRLRSSSRCAFRTPPRRRAGPRRSPGCR